jgi:hypothetical protein
MVLRTHAETRTWLQSPPREDVELRCKPDGKGDAVFATVP